VGSTICTAFQGGVRALVYRNQLNREQFKVGSRATTGPKGGTAAGCWPFDVMTRGTGTPGQEETFPGRAD